MAEILDLDKVEGFFRGLYLNILNSCPPDEVQRFERLRDDESRIIFMMNRQTYKDLTFTRVADARTETNALQMKKSGNGAFLAKNWQLALDFYNKCVLNTPTGNGEVIIYYSLISNAEFKFGAPHENIYNPNIHFVCFHNKLAEQLAIALANRSAALYHLEKYDLALNDIALAEQAYPKEIMYKLKERAARCHLANKNLESALKAFK